MTDDTLTILVLEIKISPMVEGLTKLLFFMSSFKMNNSYNAECSYISVNEYEKIFFIILDFSKNISSKIGIIIKLINSLNFSSFIVLRKINPYPNKSNKFD